MPTMCVEAESNASHQKTAWKISRLIGVWSSNCKMQRAVGSGCHAGVSACNVSLNLYAAMLKSISTPYRSPEFVRALALYDDSVQCQSAEAMA